MTERNDTDDAIWHLEATNDTGTSHTLHPRQYVVKCEWCQEAFFAPTKAKAMERFRAHERERLDTGTAAIKAKFSGKTASIHWGGDGA